METVLADRRVRSTRTNVRLVRHTGIYAWERRYVLTCVDHAFTVERHRQVDLPLFARPLTWCSGCQEAAVNSSQPVGERTFGVEIEFFGISAYAAQQAIEAAGVPVQHERYNHSTRSYWKIITDASVNGEGLECVSPILSGRSGFEAVEKVMTALREAGARVDRTCGLHVHHGVDDMSGNALANLVELYAGRQAAIDHLVAPSRRGSSQRNHYFMPLNEYEVREAAEMFRSNRTAAQINRYRTLNVRSFPLHGTIEIRQHQGTLNGKKAVAWIEFGQALFAAAKASDTLLPETVFEMLSHLKDEHGLSADAAGYLVERAMHFSANS